MVNRKLQSNGSDPKRWHRDVELQRAALIPAGLRLRLQARCHMQFGQRGGIQMLRLTHILPSTLGVSVILVDPPDRRLGGGAGILQDDSHRVEQRSDGVAEHNS